VTPNPMHDDEIVLSPAKYKELEIELERLQTVERRHIAERIKEARGMGDLSENFDYHDAKRQQGFLEGKIIGLKQTLERAKVIEMTTGSETVTLGSVVKVHDDEFDEEIEYTIVGVMEADPSTDKISNTSPVGQALMNHRAGDKVQVQTPAGISLLEILEVR
jgi:transcription elongation factor GreA